MTTRVLHRLHLKLLLLIDDENPWLSAVHGLTRSHLIAADTDPTRKIVIKGKAPRPKKSKFLNQFEVQALLKELELGEQLNWDWFILLVVKTGLRFSEALALTPKDFDFSKQKITIEKTWNYKNPTGFFQSTKNESSKRKVQTFKRLLIVELKTRPFTKIGSIGGIFLIN
jgi:integrase